MAIQEALNEGERGVYNEGIHARFISWKDLKGHTLARIATMMGRSTAGVSQYINQKYAGDLAEMEKDIANLLRREEELEFSVAPPSFVLTAASKLIWDVLEYCDRTQKMGVITLPSGTGKTETANEYKRRNRNTVLITLDITCRSPGNVIRRVADRTGGQGRRYSISDLLESVIDRLKGSRRLLIVDEAHFMSWEALELMRKIHDCAKVGIVYVGQERLYDQMRGNDGKAYLFDQIYSRISIKRESAPVKKRDVDVMAKTVWPELDAPCVDALFQKARTKGRFRVMKDLLELAITMHHEQSRPMDPELLQDADEFLMKA